LPPPTDFPFPPTGRFVWRHVIGPGRWLFDRYFSFTYEGKEHIPGGAKVVACNHFSHLDPVVAGAVIGPIRYLAVDELYGSSRFFDWLTTFFGAIPMSRTRVPLGALRLALAELTEGGTVGVFPEGVRVWRWGEQKPKRGAAWLAVRAGVPLLPVAITGTEEAMGRGTARISRHPIHVAVLPGIDPADVAGFDDPIGEMTRRWEEVVGEAIEARYGR
jgi:1-acyl-sn-glycerol-3-phosphate acyltransferase